MSSILQTPSVHSGPLKAQGTYPKLYQPIPGRRDNFRLLGYQSQDQTTQSQHFIPFHVVATHVQ